jgi:hypothetical protein
MSAIAMVENKEELAEHEEIIKRIIRKGGTLSIIRECVDIAYSESHEDHESLEWVLRTAFMIISKIAEKEICHCDKHMTITPYHNFAIREHGLEITCRVCGLHKKFTHKVIRRYVFFSAKGKPAQVVAAIQEAIEKEKNQRVAAR